VIIFNKRRISDHILNVYKVFNVKNVLHVSAYEAISRLPFLWKCWKEKLCMQR